VPCFLINVAPRLGPTRVLCRFARYRREAAPEASARDAQRPALTAREAAAAVAEAVRQAAAEGLELQRSDNATGFLRVQPLGGGYVFSSGCRSHRRTIFATVEEVRS
jgi:hypothetical protein